MDESQQEFERELKALTPRALNPRLADRIAKDLGVSVANEIGGLSNGARQPDQVIAWRWLALSAVGLVASLAVVMAMVRVSKSGDSKDISTYPSATKAADFAKNKSARTEAADGSYQPVAASNVLYDMQDEGPAAAKGDNLERRVRYRYVDTYTWKDPTNNASLTWSVPRDEIRVQPAQFN